MSQSKPRQYIDFKLYLTKPPDGKGACQVALLPTPEVGESIAPVTISAEKGPPANLLPFIADKSITLRNLVEFGKGLANWLLPDERIDDQETIRNLFVDALKQAGNQGGVRLRLIIADTSLKQWPWEYAYLDPSGVGGPDAMSGFLALNPRISVVRHEPLPHQHPVSKNTSAEMTDLRMVIAAASPKTQRELEVAKEVSYITGALQDFKVDGMRLTAEPVLDATPPDVMNALQGAGSTYIFHFAGHGATETTRRDPFSIGQTREEGFLYFLDNKKEKTEVKVRADDLASRLDAAGVRLAVFGACYSGLRSERYPWDSVAGALAKKDIPAIVTMQYEVYDQHAIVFTKAFYSALAAGLSLDEAMSAGRLAMYDITSANLGQQGFLEWGVPALYSRLPDGQLFPERMERAGATAQGFRNFIQLTVDTLTKTGRVVGIKIDGSGSVFEVIMKAGVVEGEMTGAEMNKPTSGTVRMDATTVTGNMTGIKMDEK
jgi:hypothetical protein